MNKPKFKLNDIVKHLTKNKAGKVTAIWFDGEQFRYYVQHSSYTWSVPEAALQNTQNLEEIPQ